MRVAITIMIIFNFLPTSASSCVSAEAKREWYCQFYLLARTKWKTYIRLLLQPFSPSYNSTN